MKSIIAVLLALFAMVGMGAATFGYGGFPNQPPVVVSKFDTPSHTVVPGGVWLQDESFLAGSGMQYQVFDMEDGKTLVAVNEAGLDKTTMDKFAEDALARTGAVAIYFSSEHTVYKANGSVVEGVTLDLHNGPAISRALKTLF